MQEKWQYKTNILSLSHTELKFLAPQESRNLHNFPVQSRKNKKLTSSPGRKLHLDQEMFCDPKAAAIKFRLARGFKKKIINLFICEPVAKIF